MHLPTIAHAGCTLSARTAIHSCENCGERVSPKSFGAANHDGTAILLCGLCAEALADTDAGDRIAFGLPTIIVRGAA